MKLRSPVARRKSRLEIIPLIDIMFFLLASFMMVSLQMQKVRTIKASLPTATQATSTQKPDMVNLFVDAEGRVSIEKKPVSLAELSDVLAAKGKANPKIPVYITGDLDATHASIMSVLDFVRRTGIQQVAIAINAPDTK